MLIEVDLVITNNTIIVQENISLNEPVFLYVNGVSTYTFLGDHITDNVIDLSDTDVSINDSLAVMYTAG